VGAARVAADRRAPERTKVGVRVFGAVEPLTGRSISMVAKTANTFAMQEFLYGLSREIVRNDHAVLVLDRAGWHRSKHLVWPRNITPLFLPPYSPELDCTTRRTVMEDARCRWKAFIETRQAGSGLRDAITGSCPITQA